MPDDIAELVRGKPQIDSYGEIMEPDFDFFIGGANMDVSGLVSFIGVEKA